MTKLGRPVVFALCLLAGSAVPGWAQGSLQGLLHGGQQPVPGQFDFYVLSLSWSPSFCAAEAARDAGRAPSPECGAHAYAFIVHGLWPQFNHGFPQNCQAPPPRLGRALVASMLDLMPSPRLVYGEWDRHGTCSGLSARDYFDTVRRARAAVKIPPAYRDVHEPLSVSPQAVREAFVALNPGLEPDDIAVDCAASRLAEVRICMAKDLKFRACPDVVKRSCRRDRILVPPPLGHADDAGRSR